MIKFTSHSFQRERFYWISLIIVFVILVSAVLFSNVHNKNKLVDIQYREKELIAEIEYFKKLLTEKEQLLQCQPKLYNWEIEQLKKKGLKEPVKNIIDDLKNHRELIPYKGMIFYPESRIHILSPRWVYTSLDDGHICGQMLLKYKVSKKGKISWEVVDSYLGR